MTDPIRLADAVINSGASAVSNALARGADDAVAAYRVAGDLDASRLAQDLVSQGSPQQIQAVFDQLPAADRGRMSVALGEAFNADAPAAERLLASDGGTAAFERISAEGEALAPGYTAPRAANDPPPPQDAAALDAQKRELMLDITQIGLAITGIVDPTPISDGADGLISLFRGDWLGAGISVVSMVPYVGDLAKVGKLGKFAEALTRAVDIARTDPGFAQQLRPVLSGIRDAIHAAPIDSLPSAVREPLERMRTQLDEFFSAGTRVTDGPRLADGTRVADTALDLRGTSIIDPNALDALGDAARRPSVSGNQVSVSHGPDTGGSLTIINAGEAGQTVTKNGFTVTRNAEGFPILNSRFDTVLPDELLGTGDHAAHFRFANDRLGELLRADPDLARQMNLSDDQVRHLLRQPPSGDAPDGLTWHHHQDTGRMQLVDRAEHRAHRHTGGMSIWGGGYD